LLPFPVFSGRVNPPCGDRLLANRLCGWQSKSGANLNIEIAVALQAVNRFT